MDENGRYDVSIPQSRVELLIHQMIKNEIDKIKPDPGPDEGTASQDDIDGIIDNIFPDDSNSEAPDAPSGDIGEIIDNIYPDD